MDISGELETLIKRLTGGNDKEAVCRDAREFLANVEPAALRDAERRLMEKGLPVETLNRLCAIHLDLFTDGSGWHSAAVTGSDIIDVMYREHDVILDLLEELEGTGHVFASREVEAASKEVTRLPAIVDSLMSIESHHDREEQVVFVELERVKARCSPKVLGAEHKRLREITAQLHELVTAPGSDMDRFRQKAAIDIGLLVRVWWRHIFKENNIIFPSFVEYVTDEQRLMEAKSLCDQIGYAGFENVRAVHK